MAARTPRRTVAPTQEAPARRVAVGLQKLGLAMKHQEWTLAAGAGLSPTQGQLLATLAAEGPSTGSELAGRLGVKLPTVSEAVSALVEKGAAVRSADPRHHRASRIALTPRGRALARAVSRWPDFLASAVDALPEAEQDVLLTAVLKMIRTLQLRGLVPVQRMCLSCRYFRPLVHEGDAPHHCDFVDAPLPGRELRLDCPDHEPATPEAQRLTLVRLAVPRVRSPDPNP
jgi:DNA-binding MarR family transcriptional regulator